jgi:hypothetical protein
LCQHQLVTGWGSGMLQPHTLAPDDTYRRTTAQADDLTDREGTEHATRTLILRIKLDPAAWTLHQLSPPPIRCTIPLGVRITRLLWPHVLGSQTLKSLHPTEIVRTPVFPITLKRTRTGLVRIRAY